MITMSFSISQTTRSPYPKLPYEKIKNDILGKQYNLSLVFVGTAKAQRLNQEYRNKTYTPNVLSFPLDSTAGEIFITPRVAEKEARNFSLSPQGYVAFLFIHACLHLKGYNHGDHMDKLEQKYLKKYSIN